jgi:parallel beta-helix repeat protein
MGPVDGLRECVPLTAALFAAAVLTAIAIAPTQAFADHVSCGDVITEDTTLDSDLDCPDSPALVIGADHVELDLGGNHVGVFGEGVLNEGYDHVTVRNGSVGIGIAIVIRDADHNRVEDVTAWGGPGGGILLERSDHNRIVGNRAGGDELGGVLLLDGSDDNVIARNRLEAGLGSGLGVYASDGNLIRRNALSGTHTASLIVGPGADGTTVARNDFDGRSGASPSGDGIVVAAETTDTLLVRNNVRGYHGYVFLEHFGDGIRVESPSTTITRNVSDDNARWGILAVPGVIDGGGNTATGNGAGQCLNVDC